MTLVHVLFLKYARMCVCFATYASQMVFHACAFLPVWAHLKSHLALHSVCKLVTQHRT